MTPKSLSAIVLRLFGVWFFFDALFGLSQMYLYQMDLAGLAGIHRRWYDAAPHAAPLAFNSSDHYLHDTYYVVSHFSPGLVIVGLQLVFSIILLFWSKPFARLLARNLDDL